MEITDGVIQSEGGNVELQHCEKEKKRKKTIVDSVCPNVLLKFTLVTPSHAQKQQTEHVRNDI